MGINIDFDLLRKILVLIKEKFNGVMMPSSDFVKTNFREQEDLVNYHLKYLIDYGLIIGHVSGIIKIKELSIHGEEFLKTIGSDVSWGNVKEKLAPINECPLKLVMETSYSLFKNDRWQSH